MIISFIELLSPRYSSSKKPRLSWQLKRLSYPCFDACVSKTSVWRAMYVTLTFPSITTRSETLEVRTCSTKRWSWAVGVYWDQAVNRIVSHHSLLNMKRRDFSSLLLLLHICFGKSYSKPISPPNVFMPWERNLSAVYRSRNSIININTYAEVSGGFLNRLL